MTDTPAPDNKPLNDYLAKDDVSADDGFPPVKVVEEAVANSTPPPVVNEDAKAAPETPPPATPPSKKKKYLSLAFNVVALGAGAAAMKSAIAVAMFGCPPLAILLASSYAIGTMMTVACHEGKRRAQKKQGIDVPKFFSKQNAKDFFKSKENGKVFLQSFGFSLLGGALVLGFQEGVIQNFLGKIFGSVPTEAAVVASPAAPVIAAPVDVPAAPPVVETAPPAPVVETVVEESVDIPCMTPQEWFATLIQNGDVTERVQDAYERSLSTNAHVAAQGTKDLAYFALNGFDGVPKDPATALELFQKAADAGNVQAKVDLLYLQYHGLAGVTADPNAALAAMQGIDSPRADWFVEKWGGASGTATAFDSKAILGGVKTCTVTL